MAREARFFAALLALFFLARIAQAEPRWTMQFFYDKAGAVLQIRDLQCPSVAHCVAGGSIVSTNGREKGAIVRTVDGGQHWFVEEAGDIPTSLFMLSDSVGWMAARHGIWSTADGGETWRKEQPLKRILRVHFLSPEHGFAIGYSRTVLETVDGGKKWNKLAAAEREPATPQTIYDWISFSGDHGIILGKTASEEGREPVWMNPSTARMQRQQDSTSIILETLDGGKTWKSSTNSVFGDITELLLAKDGFGVALVEYHDYFGLPSSVLQTAFNGEKPKIIFAKRDRAVSDIAVFADGGALLAAIEPPGNSNQIPIPGKLRMIRSENLHDWTEEEADYRAVAQRAFVAAPDRTHAWVATDTGMILAFADRANAAH